MVFIFYNGIEKIAWEDIMKNKSMCYLIAIFVVFIWSTTFVFTKNLLYVLTPVEIIFYRYLIAYLVLFAAYPKVHKSDTIKEELLFITAGLSGGSLYFMAENYALKYTLASNVGLLVASAPMFTAILAHVFTKSEKLNKNIVYGFVVAFAGAFLVIFNGHFILKLNPLGDFLAIAAAALWAIYSITIKKIGSKYPGIYITRKVFFYCIITTLPFLVLTGFRCDITLILNIKTMLNLLFLGIVASSICFLLWSKVIWNIGAVKANNFIYFVPFITMVCSALFLSEKITVFAILGGVLIIVGVYISENTKK